MVSDSRPRLAKLAFLVLLALFLYFAGMGKMGLHDPDETRYAEIGREMWESGNYVVPHFNYMPYLDKPPLTYWATCLGFKLFGVNEVGARFFPAFCGLGGVVAAYLFGCLLFGEAAAFRGAIALATAALYFFMARILVMDMVMTFFVTLAVGFFYMSWKRDRRWLIAAYAAMALGAMSKGPVGVLLPMIPFGAFILIKERVRGIRYLISLPGVAAFLVIWVPWHVAIYFARPEFFEHFFLRENVGGFFSPLVHHPGSAYVTTVHLVIGFLPWTLFLPSVIQGFFSMQGRRREAAVLCLLWAATPVVLFTLSISKLPTYVLPAMAPLALLVGVVAPNDQRPALAARIVVALLGLACCVGAAVCGVCFAHKFVGLERNIQGMAVIALLLSILATVLLLRSVSMSAFVVSALFMPVCLGYVLVAHTPDFLEHHSGRAIARAIEQRGDFRKIALYCRQHPNLCFYLRSPMALVDAVPQQYRLGLALSDRTDIFLSSRDLAVMASREPGIYCIVRENEVELFEKGLGHYFKPCGKFNYDLTECLFVSLGKPPENAPSPDTLPSWGKGQPKISIILDMRK